MAKKAEELKNTTPVADEASAESNSAELAPETTPETPEVTEETSETEEKFAKSGKKSKKHIEEVKAEQERQAKKSDKSTEPTEKAKGATPIARPKIERRGKKYQEVAKKIDRTKLYSLEDALKLAIETSPTKFDATIELHARLGVDPRQADQNIRATVVLPAGTGKDIKVAVFAPEDLAKKAKAAGADIAEDEEFLKRLDKGTIDFDILVSTPQYMPKLGKYARLLGPKGLMPNPKAGTVSADVEKAVKEAKAGKVEYRVDKQAIVHIGLGKLSFGPDKLASNCTAFLDSLRSNKPASIKGTFVRSLYLTTTMGPSIPLEISL